MASDPIVTIFEDSRVSSPPGTIGERSLPLTFFDMTWLLTRPVHYVLFYPFPHSKSHFLETVVPNLKHSLSLTLKHFFPFASNLFVFPNADDYGVIRKPEIRHVEGDYVALTFAECSLDFNDLTGNHPRKCENFYPLVPPLGNVVRMADYVTVPVFSVQVTYFRDSGIAIGTTNHHCLGDASTRFGFLMAWTSIAKSGGDESFVMNGSPPILDRLIDIPKLAEKKLRHTSLETFYQPPSLVGATKKVRATFILSRTNIDQLKKRVLTQIPTLEYISSFTVTCGYIWSCIVKSLVKMGEKLKGEDELEQFIVTVNCRSRMDPPLPSTYFGNCDAPCITTIKNGVLSSENGFVFAAKLIGEAINKMVNNKEGILKDAERWHEGFKIPARKIGIEGTPKLNFYDVDFGWGKPQKYDAISIDYKCAVAINASKKSTQDFEIGLCFPSIQMEAFADIFNRGLESEI